jgi:hypothetical protein
MSTETNKNASGSQRPSQSIDLLSQIDTDYWCQIFHVTPAQLREAVQGAGPQAVDVSHYLRTKGYLGTS